jgi:hypothetical protein
MQLFFTQLLIKTLVINRVKVNEGGSGDLSSKVGTHFARHAFLLFFPPRTFSPELEVSEEKILKRNPARKKEAGAKVDHPMPTSHESMDELSCDRS